MVARMSFSYPDEMKDKLKKLADEDCRSLSGYVQKVLTEHIESRRVTTPEKKKRKVKNARVKRKQSSASC